MKFLSILSLILIVIFSTNVIAQEVKTFYHNQIDPLSMEEGQAVLQVTGEPITGRLITNYDNGQLRLEGYYVNGQRQGAFRWWYPSGQLGSEEIFLANKKDGISRMWHPNGQIKQQGEYKNGTLKGRMKYWQENGSLRKIRKRQ